MLESPVLQEWFAERDIKTRQLVILESLEVKFGSPVPPDVSVAVRAIKDEARLKQLLPLMYSSTTLDEFRARLAPPAANTPAN